jgi:hypothetical protein
MVEKKVAGLPEHLNEIAQKLMSYGFELRRDRDAWVLKFPEGDTSGLTEVAFYDHDLATGLLRVLRQEEQKRGAMYRYEQFDKRWGKIVYGRDSTYSTIAEGGCGPTSLAIILHNLLNDPRRSGSSSQTVSPVEAAKYAAYHGRVKGQGTAISVMVRDLKKQWPDLDGMPVTLEEAVQLLEEGRLIIFRCKGCKGYSKNRPLHRAPDVTYGGHIMVLAGVEGPPGPDQIFYVVDPGRNEQRAMRLIKRSEFIARRCDLLHWVFRSGDPATRVSR